jgi:methionyl-tRNA formyltransferase
MRIAFFGLPLGALALARDGHDVALACISRPTAIGMRRLRRTVGPERIVRTPDVLAEAFVARVRAVRPDLVVSWFWTTRIPRAVLDIAPLGGFGVHPSLLPRHRGPDPYFWAIDAGDPVTGVTAHVLDDQYDTGAILGQRVMALDPSWNAWRLARRLDRPSLALLREVVAAFGRGQPPPRVRQDERSATLAPEPSEESLVLRWEEPAIRIARRVRAAAPWPGVLTQLGEAPVVLLRVRETDDFPRVLLPG